MTADARKTLIDQARQGDEEAQARLFEAASDRVLLYIRLRMGDRLRQELDSLDILQEAFAAAQRDLPGSGIRDLGSYLAWLCRIVENRIHQQVDKMGAAKRRPPGEREAMSAVMDRVRARHTGPQTAVHRIERREKIAAAIDKEPEDIRRALLARFFEGRTIDEIAVELGKSPSGVRRLLGEAAIRLGDQLRELGETS